MLILLILCNCALTAANYTSTIIPENASSRERLDFGILFLKILGGLSEACLILGIWLIGVYLYRRVYKRIKTKPTPKPTTDVVPQTIPDSQEEVEMKVFFPVEKYSVLNLQNIEGSQEGSSNPPPYISEERELSRQFTTSCFLCSRKYEDGDNVGILKCQHYFHEGCIKSHQEIFTPCPLCPFSSRKEKTMEV